jgi:hypothetical protein
MTARRASLLALAGAVCLSFVAPPARAADPKPAETALGQVPADADYFQSLLRTGETVEIIGRSRAWKQVWNDPSVQELWKKAVEAYRTGDDWKALREFLTDPANAELPALAADALSHEMFLYAGGGTADLVMLVRELVGGTWTGPGVAQLKGQDPEAIARDRVRAVLKALAEKPDRLRVPAVVVGFKVSEPAKVTAQLKRLDPLLALALAGTPLKGRSKRVTVDGDEFLVLELDGSLAPWDDIPLDKYEDKPGEFAPLVKKLKALKLTVAVGVRKGYLLVAVGGEADHLAKFGGPGPKLADVPELKPLAKHAGKPLTAVGYASAKLRRAFATTPEDVLGYAELAKAALAEADLPDDVRGPLEKDIEALARAYAKGIRPPGAATSFSFRTPRGWETYAHDYSPAGPTSARPLTLLNHLGGDPLLAAVWRSGTTVEDYRALVKWATVFAGHAEKVAAAKYPDAAPSFELARKEVFPILRELSDAAEKLWLPALADGQEGIVLDAKWASRKWHPALEADRELPLPELGVIVGVSDAAKLEQALEAYRTGANKLIAKARELAPPGSVPEFEIPKPTVERKDGRTFAHYPIPEGWGIDPQFRPTGGLSAKVAVLTLSRGHAERLLEPTPLRTDLAPFADLKRPLESAFYFNWTGVVEAVGPWVGFLTRKEVLGEKTEEAGAIAAKVLAYLKVFRAYGSATYREGGATVTHSEAVFADLDPPPGK